MAGDPYKEQAGRSEKDAMTEAEADGKVLPVGFEDGAEARGHGCGSL